MPTDFMVGEGQFTMYDGNGNIVMQGSVKDFNGERIINKMDGFNSITSLEDFKIGKYVVNCKTEKLAREFLSLCECKGFKWCSGEKLLSNMEWDKYKGDTCYHFGECKMEYCSVEYYARKSTSIVGFTGVKTNKIDPMNPPYALLSPFSTYIQPPTTTTREIIEVIYHRSETIVLIKTLGKHYKGISRCDPLDTYSKEFGFTVAYERARENQDKGRY